MSDNRYSGVTTKDGKGWQQLKAGICWMDNLKAEFSLNYPLLVILVKK